MPDLIPTIAVLAALRDHGWALDARRADDGDTLYRRGREMLWLRYGHTPRRVTSARYAFDREDEKLPQKGLNDAVLELVKRPRR